MPFLSTFLVALLAIEILSCGPKEEPVYDADIGLTAVPVAEGSLEGSFALRVFTNAMADLSFLGVLESISETFWLIQRTYDAETQTYAQTLDFCTAINYEIAGMTTSGGFFEKIVDSPLFSFTKPYELDFHNSEIRILCLGSLL